MLVPNTMLPSASLPISWAGSPLPEQLITQSRDHIKIALHKPNQQNGDEIEGADYLNLAPNSAKNGLITISDSKIRSFLLLITEEM